MERHIFPAKNCHSCEIKNKNKIKHTRVVPIRGKMKNSATKHEFVRDKVHQHPVPTNAPFRMNGM